MSAVIKVRKRKNLTFSTVMLWVVLGFAALFFLASYGQELLLAHDLNDRAAAQRLVNNAARDENTRLQAQLQYVGSDKYIEQRAREALNLRRPEEEVLIPIQPVTQTGTGKMSGTAQASPAVTPSATSSPNRATWEKWLDLFSAP